jgi:hypothetical protein
VRIAFPVNRDTDYFPILEDGRFLWLRNARSAFDPLYASVEGHDGGKEGKDDESGSEDAGVQVILPERDY